MADGDGGKRGRGEQLFQPLDAGQVQVIGGLVEQHDFGVSDQGLGDGQPLAPAAGECGGLGIQEVKAGPSGKFSQAALALAFSDMNRRERPLQHLAQAEAGGKSRVLRHIGGAGALADSQLARVRLDLAGKNRQQGRFSGAIGADEPDAGAVLDGEGNIKKQRLGAELFGHGLEVQNRRHLI